MRAKLEAGAYSAWDTFAADLDLMFTNALTYNIKGDQVWVYTNRLKANAENMLRTAKAGRARVGGRGGSATTAARRKKQAEKAERKKEADQARAAARAEQRAAQEQKVLKRAGVAGTEEEDTARMTYKGAPGDGFLASWGGLGGGASGEGAPFGWGRQVIRPSNHIPSAAGYAASVLHFARNLKGKARAIAEKLAAIARAASDAVVYPPQAEDASTAAVAAGAKSGKGRKPKQQAQAQAQPSGAAAALVNPSLPPATLPSAAPLDLTSSYAQPAPALAAAQNARLMAAQTAAAVGAQPSAPVVAQLPGMNLGQLPFGMPMLQVGAGAAGQVFVPAAPGTVPAQQFVQLPQGATFLQPQQQQ